LTYGRLCCLQVVPCVLLTVLSALLIVAMRRADRRRRLLKMKGRRLESEKAGEYNRTTSMLVAVVLCFVVTELPQGVLAFLSGIDKTIFDSVYTQLGDVWDIVVLINSSVNFLLYCAMSRLFRGTFWELFIAPLCLRCTHTADNEHADRNGRLEPPIHTTSMNRIEGRSATNV